MVLVRGTKRETSVVRHGRTGLAWMLTFGIASGCGSRSMLVEDGNSAGEAGDETGGTGGIGKGGTAPASGGKGGAYPNGGTTSPGTGGSYGGTVGGTYGTTGGSPTGGTSGTSYGGGGGTSGTYPGKGGTYGKGGSAGYPMTTGGTGGTGVAGSAGGRGGKGGYGGTGTGGTGVGATGGVAGSGGSSGNAYSPAVLNACNALCKNLPASCSLVTPTGDCVAECQPLSYEFPSCELEVADYLECVASRLDPGAMCMVDQSTNSCYGPGCSTTAQNACATELEILSQCSSGYCDGGVGVGNASCSYATQCPSHSHSVECNRVDAKADQWACNCFVDGESAFQTYVYGRGSYSCEELSQACNFAK